MVAATATAATVAKEGSTIDARGAAENAHAQVHHRCAWEQSSEGESIWGVVMSVVVVMIGSVS